MEGKGYYNSNRNSRLFPVWLSYATDLDKTIPADGGSVVRYGKTGRMMKTWTSMTKKKKKLKEMTMT